MTKRSEETDSRLPLYQRVRDRIAQGIGRTWRPGDAIPSESELAKTHGVALGTLRRPWIFWLPTGCWSGFRERERSFGEQILMRRCSASSGFRPLKASGAFLKAESSDARC